MSNDKIANFLGLGPLMRNDLFLTNYALNFQNMMNSKVGTVDFHLLYGFYPIEQSQGASLYPQDLENVCENTCNQTYPTDVLRELCTRDCSRQTKKIARFGIGIGLIFFMFIAGFIYLLYVLYKKVSSSKW